MINQLKNIFQKNLPEILLFLTVLPIIINWVAIQLNWHLLEPDDRPGGYLDNNINMDEIVLPNVFTGFWSQLLWTFLFLILTLLSVKHNKLQSFPKWASFELVLFSFFITWIGSFMVLIVPTISITLFVILTIAALIFAKQKKWAWVTIFLLLWPIYVNLAGAIYANNTF